MQVAFYLYFTRWYMENMKDAIQSITACATKRNQTVSRHLKKLLSTVTVEATVNSNCSGYAVTTETGVLS